MELSTRLIKLMLCLAPFTLLLASCNQGLREAELQSGSNPALTDTCLQDLLADYQANIKPIWSTYSCSACHYTGGAAASSNFLLVGSDVNIMQDIFGLMNASNINNSLILTKPTNTVAHGGGQIFASASPDGDAMRTFIQDSVNANFCQ